MIDRFLASLVDFARRRTWALAVFVAGSVLLSAFALTVPLDFSFSGVMNRDHPEVARYFAASEAYGLGGLLALLVEGEEGELDRAVSELRTVLRALPEVRSVDDPGAADWLFASAPWWIESAVFDSWIASLGLQSLDEASSGAARAREVEEALRELKARVSPGAVPGARLVRIVLARDTFEMALDAEDFPRIRRATLEALESHDMNARFAGMPAIVTQEQEATLERMARLGPLSLVIVLTILLSVERSLAMLASVAVPMLLAVGTTLALVGGIAGELTLMESIFGVMVFGLGIDFAVHLLLRLREEQARGFAFEESLHRAFLGTGRGVVAGGLTTAGAFFILALSPDPVFYRLGLSGGLGLSLCLLFLLLMLPVQWEWIDRRRTPTRAGPTSERPARLGRLASACARKPGLVLSVAALILLGAIVQSRSLSYETNLERVFSREIEALDTARRIDALFGVHPGVWMVATRDLEEARATASAFDAHPLFDRTESVAAFLSSDIERRRPILEGVAQAFAAQQERSPTGGAGQEAEDPRIFPTDPLALLLAAARSGPPSLETLPDSIRERLMGPGGELLVLAYTKHATMDSAVAAEERRAAQAIHPEATSMSAIYEALIGTDRPWLPPILIGVALFVAGVLRVDLGSFRLTLLALVPALCSLVATMGLLSSLGFSLNTVTLVAFPLLLGLGVDDGIHVTHRMLEEPTSSLGAIIGSVAKSIALTTATTCGSVALLLLSRHPGIESVAIVLLVGLPAALLSTLTVLPALAVMIGEGRDRAS